MFAQSNWPCVDSCLHTMSYICHAFRAYSTPYKHRLRACNVQQCVQYVDRAAWYPPNLPLACPSASSLLNASTCVCFGEARASL